MVVDESAKDRPFEEKTEIFDEHEMGRPFLTSL